MLYLDAPFHTIDGVAVFGDHADRQQWYYLPGVPRIATLCYMKDLQAIGACTCTSGCPACVQSPKCGNGNEPLDKAAAISALAAVLDLLGRPVSPRSGPEPH